MAAKTFPKPKLPKTRSTSKVLKISAAPKASKGSKALQRQKKPAAELVAATIVTPKENAKRAVTSYDVALRAGISQSAV